MTTRVVLGMDSVRQPLTGVGAYTFCLAKELLKNKDVELSGVSHFRLLRPEVVRDKLLELSVGDGKTNALISPPLMTHSKVKMLARASSSVVTHFNLKRFGGDFVYHVPNYVGGGNAEKKVITIHDLSHLDYPEFHPKERVAFMRKGLQKAITPETEIIVDTEFTKERLLDSGLVNNNSASRISVVYLGVSSQWSAPAQLDDNVLQNFSLSPNGYIVSVGTIEPRKNHLRLIKAYLKLDPSQASLYPLVICGSFGWLYSDVISLLKEVRPPYRVVVTGYISHQDLMYLVKYSLLLAYPSLYEGFGMPILEGMAAGVPVLTSNIGATKEVAGDAAILVNPLSIDSIALGLSDAISDGDFRLDYVLKGKDRVAMFSWSKCARETVDVYNRLA